MKGYSHTPHCDMSTTTTAYTSETLIDDLLGDEMEQVLDRLHRHCSWPQDLHHLHQWGDGLCLCSVGHLSLLNVLSSIPGYPFSIGTPSSNESLFLNNAGQTALKAPSPGGARFRKPFDAGA